MNPDRIVLLDGTLDIGVLEKQIIDKSIEVIRDKQFIY